MEKTKNGKSKKNNRLCRARGKLGSSWLLAITVSMVSLNLCPSFSSSLGVSYFRPPLGPGNLPGKVKRSDETDVRKTPA